MRVFDLGAPSNPAKFSKSLKSIKNHIQKRTNQKVGFVVQTAFMDMNFEKLRDKLLNVILNTTTAQDHVGEIKRKTRMVKERAKNLLAFCRTYYCQSF